MPLYNQPLTIKRHATATRSGTLLLIIDIILLPAKERINIVTLRECGGKIRSYKEAYTYLMITT